MRPYVLERERAERACVCACTHGAGRYGAGRQVALLGDKQHGEARHGETWRDIVRHGEA